MSLTLPRVADNSPFPATAYNLQAAAVEGHDDRIAALESKVAVQVDVTSSDSIASTGSYQDLQTTTGPAAGPIALKAGQQCEITVSCEAFATTAGARMYMSFAVSGASTAAPDDFNAAKKRAGTVNDDTTSTRSTIFTAPSTGNYTFTAKYKLDPTGTGAAWQRRRIIVRPL